MKNLVYLLIAVVLSSCEHKSHLEFGASAFVNETFEVVTPPEMIDPKQWQSTVINEQDYLIKAENYDGNLKVYPLNLNSRAYEPTILIPQEGPNGHNSVKARFFVHNFDSIFVFPFSKGEMYLYDSDGVKLDVFYYSEGHEVFYMANYSKSTVSLLDDKMLFSAAGYFSPNSAEFYEKVKPTQQFDLETRKLKPLMSYPGSIENRFLPIQFIETEQVYIQNADRVVVNFSFDPFLYLLNVETGKKEKRFAGLNGFRHLSPSRKPYDDVSGLLSSVTYPQYQGLIYDRYREKYYRLVRYLKNPRLADNSVELLENLQSPRGLASHLIELNEDFSFRQLVETPSLRKYYCFTQQGLVLEANYDGEREGYERYELISLHQKPSVYKSN